MKTRKARVQRFLDGLGEWCRSHRHLPLKDQHAALSRRLRGHFRYFGVNGNRNLQQVRHHTVRLWMKWLQRRSQRRKTSDLEAVQRLSPGASASAIPDLRADLGRGSVGLIKSTEEPSGATSSLESERARAGNRPGYSTPHPQNSSGDQARAVRTTHTCPARGAVTPGVSRNLPFIATRHR